MTHRNVVPDKLSDVPSWFADWMSEQPTELILLLHDLCHVAMVQSAGEGAKPSQDTLRKRFKSLVALEARGSN